LPSPSALLLAFSDCSLSCLACPLSPALSPLPSLPALSLALSC
jgi:hypothetical protein